MKRETSDENLIEKVGKHLPEATEFLKSQEDVAFAYLFGSFADGTATDRSDIDIGVYFLKSTQTERFSLTLTMEVKLDQIFKTDRTQCIALNDAPSTLGYDTILKGKLLFNKDDNLLADYEIHTLSKYFDEDFYRKERYSILRERILA